MYKSKIDKIGVEIEGGWKHDHQAISKVYGDGSVHIEGYEEVDDSYDEDEGVAGEVRSEPLTNLRSIKKWIKDSYPSITNDTCGLHIHLSTKQRAHYALLMHKKFYNTFLEGMTEWGKRYLGNRSNEDKSFWNRLNGNNSYCHREWSPLAQIKGNYRHDKYNLLNYLAFFDHGTLECRLFPAFKSLDKSILGVQFYVKFVDAYLKTMKPNNYTKKYLQELEKAL